MDSLVLNPMVPELYQVNEKLAETYDTFTLSLSSESSSNDFIYLPGQFNMLYAFGVGEVPISISGDPRESKHLLHTIRDVGMVTHALHKLEPGQSVGLRGPFGSSWPIEKAKGNDVVIIAGGIGLAPLRPALYAMLSKRDQYGDIALLYGARRPEDLLYTNEFETWRGRYGIQVKVTVDSSEREWRGNVGVVTTLVPRVTFDPANTVAMICGPEVMMQFASLELQHCGISDENIFLTMERNMKCAIGFCGHCQYGPAFICKDGPVFSLDRVQHLLEIREI